MICSNCGKEIKAQSKFCPKCGMAISIDQELNNNILNENNESDKSDSIDYKRNANKNSSYRLSIPRRIFSIAICLFLFLFTIISSTICVVRVGFQEERIKEIVSNEDILEIKINDGNEEKYLSDFIISNLSKTIAEKYNIGSNQVDEILSDEKVNDLIGSLITDYTSMFVFGSSPDNLNEASIINNIKGLDDLIYSKTYYRFTDKDYEDIKNELSQGSLSFLIEDKIEGLIGVDPYKISMFFSIPVMCISFVAVLGLLILLFKTNNWKIKSSFAFLGMTWIVSGAIYLLAALVVLIGSLINQAFVISVLLRSLSMMMLICAGIIIFVGFILFIIQNKLIKNRC